MPYPDGSLSARLPSPTREWLGFAKGSVNEWTRMMIADALGASKKINPAQQPPKRLKQHLPLFYWDLASLSYLLRGDYNGGLAVITSQLRKASGAFSSPQPVVEGTLPKSWDPLREIWGRLGHDVPPLPLPLSYREVKPSEQRPNQLSQLSWGTFSIC